MQVRISFLSLKGVSVSYGNIAAVEDLSLRVYTDEIVTLIGSNGAGNPRRFGQSPGCCGQRPVT